MDYNKRYLEIIDLTLIGTNPTVLIEYIDNLVFEAHIAGSCSTRSIGLNLSKEERSDQYCREKGLRI